MCANIIYCEYCRGCNDSEYKLTNYNIYNGLLIDDDRSCEQKSKMNRHKKYNTKYKYKIECYREHKINVADMSHITKNDQLVGCIKQYMYQEYNSTQDLKGFLSQLYKINNPELMVDILVYIDQEKQKDYEINKRRDINQASQTCRVCKEYINKYWW